MGGRSEESAIALCLAAGISLVQDQLCIRIRQRTKLAGRSISKVTCYAITIKSIADAIG